MMTKEEFQNVLRDDLCINCCLRRNGEIIEGVGLRPTHRVVIVRA